MMLTEETDVFTMGVSSIHLKKLISCGVAFYTPKR